MNESTSFECTIQQMKGCEEFAKKTQLLRDTLKLNSSKAPKILQSMVQLSINNGLSPKWVEEAAQILVEFIDKASIYKRRRMAQKISQLDLTTKIVITRELSSAGVKNFPIDQCLSKESRKGKIKDGIMKFRKPAILQAMAFGENKNFRLGIGPVCGNVPLTKVRVPGEVVRVHMGVCHTIFELSTGELYGCGKASNFLEGPVDSEHNIADPVKLQYLVTNPNITTKIIITDDSTTIVDFNALYSLVIGYCAADVSKIRSKGDNWTIIQKRGRREEKHVVDKLQVKTVDVKTHNGCVRSVSIYDDGQWMNLHNQKSDIAFLIDGFRVDGEKLWKNYTVCPNGTIYAFVDNNIYTGELILVPKGRQIFGEDDSEDDDDEDVGGTAADDDVVFLKRDDVLLAVLKELVMPMCFDGCGICQDGESFVVFPKTHSRPSYNYHKFRATETPIEFDLSKIRRSSKEIFDAKLLMEKFEELCAMLETAANSPDLYCETGFPRFTVLIRAFLALQHFLRLDASTGMTENLVKNVINDTSLDVESVKDQVTISLNAGHRIPVIVAKTDWSDANAQERKQEIRTKSREYLLNLISSVRPLVAKLNELPLRYRANGLESQFGKFVDDILQSWKIQLHEGCDLKTMHCSPPDRPPEREFKRGLCELALKERLESGDIVGNQPRWNLVRVEAVPILSECRPFMNGHYGEQFIYSVYTSRCHISCIDSSLEKHIDENNVLNLNKVFIDNPNPDDFINAMDSFFYLRHDFFHLNNFDRKIDIDDATRSINDKYTINCAGGVTIEGPKVLFEMFSLFDAGRRRHAESIGSDVNTLELDFRPEALKLAMACLVDVRVFYRAPMDLKLEVYAIATFCIFTHVKSELLKIIVLTAEEKDSQNIGDLIWQQTDDMVDLIARLRPDIALFWRNLQMREKHLQTLNLLAQKMHCHHYERFEASRECFHLPIIASRDEKVGNERINPKFLRTFLSDDQQDGDIQWELMKTILSWDAENPRRRKRCFPYQM